MFDIQKFADEESNAENFSIPEELEGISEEVAREVMTEHAEKNPEPVEVKEDFDEEGNR